MTTFNQSMMHGLYQCGQHAEKQQMAGRRQGAAVVRPRRDRRWRSRGPGRSWPCTAAPGYGARHCQRLYCDYNMARGAEPGRIVVQAVRARDRGQAGHGRAEQRAERLLADLDPAGLDGADRAMLSARSLRPGSPRSQPVRLVGVQRAGENSLRPSAVPGGRRISSDPAFEDLTHRVGVQNVTRHGAQAFGVGADVDLAQRPARPEAPSARTAATRARSRSRSARAT